MTLSAKKKSVSKRNKASWRKHIDIKDVEDFQENQRLEERIGSFSDKTNDELFVVDTKSNPKLLRLTARQLRKKAGRRPPRCFLGLENMSKVQDPIAKRNHVVSKAKPIHETKSRKIQRKELIATEDRLKTYKIQDARNRKRKIFNKDVWMMGDLKDQRSEFKSQWIERHVTDHNLCNTGTPIAAIPKSIYSNRSQLNAVSLPHPGTSYNPSLEDHQDLLNNVFKQELKIIHGEEHLDRVTTSMFIKVTEKERDLARHKELSSGIGKHDHDEEEENSLEDSAGVHLSANPLIVIKKKDKKARRKQREQKEMKKHLLKVKLEKKKVTDIHRLRHLNEEIQKKEASLQIMRQRKAIRREQRKAEPHRLGKQKFKEEDIELNMPEDISGNLRNVKMEGNILKDRFKSMQQRNILAPTVDLGLRKRREIKRFVRNNHKEEQLPINSKIKKSNIVLKK